MSLRAIKTLAWTLSAALTGLTSPALGADTTDLAQSFPQGRGARYHMTVPGGWAGSNLLLSVAESRERRVAIEYYFSEPGSFIPIELWQRFEIEAPAGAKPKVLSGLIQAQGWTEAQILPTALLGGVGDLEVSDFLFARKSELQGRKKGTDEIATPAAKGGKLKADRYETVSGGQKFTYWISEQAKPFGLVKLKSEGPKPQHRYELLLQALVENVGPKIDPAKAKALDAEGRALLEPLAAK